VAKQRLEELEIDGLIVIGGDGSLRGAHALSQIWDGQIIGVPGTIDNDLFGSDYTIGCDTAVNTALEAIDKIRDTADAHERTFLVEVMGRHCGFNAVQVGIGGGAEEVLIPETISKLDAVVEYLAESAAKGKTSSILIVAEGEEEGGAIEIAKKLKEKSGQDYRAIVLGHMQRGGCPTAMDRVLGTELGAYAVDRFIEGDTKVMVGKIGNRLTTTPLEKVFSEKKPLDSYQIQLLPLLAT
jgi:6-phosphofructokinase 1